MYLLTYFGNANHRKALKFTYFHEAWIHAMTLPVHSLITGPNKFYLKMEPKTTN